MSNGYCPMVHWIQWTFEMSNGHIKCPLDICRPRNTCMSINWINRYMSMLPYIVLNVTSLLLCVFHIWMLVSHLFRSTFKVSQMSAMLRSTLKFKLYVPHAGIITLSLRLHIKLVMMTSYSWAIYMRNLNVFASFFMQSHIEWLHAYFLGNDGIYQYNMLFLRS
jgi:hypothetical protein